MPPVGDSPSINLGVASHFSHGWSPQLLEGGNALGVSNYRDSLRWDQVEQMADEYRFEKWRTQFPDAIAESGGRVSVTLLGVNDLYDEGHTVHSQEGRAALAKFVHVVLDRFENIETIEIGNEINGENFVSGPMKSADYRERAAFHTRMLEAVHAEVKSRHPNVRILGGAVHSIPVDFIRRQFESGAGALMDGLAIHPYTSPPEQLAEELAYLRSAAIGPDFPIHVSEFGTTETELAADYLVKMISVMAAEGVHTAHWYALSALGRKASTVPLLDDQGAPTQVGRAFSFARSYIVTHPITDVSPDAYSYVFQVGDRTLVIWGESRTLKVERRAVVAFDADGTRLERLPETISPDQVTILTSASPLRFGKEVRLGSTDLLADSFHDFSLNEGRDRNGRADTFRRFFARGEEEIALRTLGGGERKSSPWTPHLSTRFHRPMYINASRLVPGAFGSDNAGAEPVDVVHRFTAAEAQTIAVRTILKPGPNSADGVRFQLRSKGANIRNEVVRGQIDSTSSSLALAAGESIDVRIGVNGNPKGDTTEYRIQILRK